MGRPRKPEDEAYSDSVTFRLNDELSQRLRGYRRALQERTPFMDVTTASTVRYLIDKGLRSCDLMEART